MKVFAFLLPVLVALQVGVQPALAWAWPVDGPVLRPFVLGDDPYAGGQHRGIDIGAPAGTPVHAPASGTISFAGTVPTGGKTITIRTADGYAVTLQRLGSTSVSRGVAVGEGNVVGSIGDASEPYVYLGVRKADEPNGYVDPLGLLPPLAPAPAPEEQTPDEPDPAPAPAHGSMPRHHSHATPAAVAVEEPSVEPAPDTHVAQRAHAYGGRRRSDIHPRKMSSGHPALREPLGRPRPRGAPFPSPRRRCWARRPLPRKPSVLQPLRAQAPPRRRQDSGRCSGSGRSASG